jgi:hypothetical protein
VCAGPPDHIAGLDIKEMLDYTIEKATINPFLKDLEVAF